MLVLFELVVLSGSRRGIRVAVSDGGKLDFLRFRSRLDAKLHFEVPGLSEKTLYERL